LYPKLKIDSESRPLPLEQYRVWLKFKETLL
jgi:hypothetical protein